MAGTKVAHDIATKPRTGDIAVDDSVDFRSLLLSEPVLQGLTAAGFHRPSPIQLKAIPLGRCGLDLIVQAKSGTGKTCVFSVISLEAVNTSSCSVQILVLAPTREIAVQIWEVINSLGSSMKELRCYTFIGGMPVEEDIKKLKRCQIAIGTPGRVKQLLEQNLLPPDSIRLFILDEADKLLEDSFQETVNWIYSCLPASKQMLALSATYPESLAQHLTHYMQNPTFVRLNTSDPALLGIRQYYKSVPFHPIPHKIFEHKVQVVLKLLSSISFNQCLIFSNYQTRAESLCDLLTSHGWPAAFISGSQDQQHRLTAMAKLKQYKCRILVTTDLTSRGIDAENVNLVLNLDNPRDHETYLHRIGRAGRFGTYGAAIVLASEGKELDQLCDIQDKCNTDIIALPDPVPSDLAKASGFVSLDRLVTTEQLSSVNPSPKLDDMETETKVHKEGRLEKSAGRVKLEDVDMEECGKNVNGGNGENFETEAKVLKEGFPQKSVGIVKLEVVETEESGKNLNGGNGEIDTENQKVEQVQTDVCSYGDVKGKTVTVKAGDTETLIASDGADKAEEKSTETGEGNLEDMKENRREVEGNESLFVPAKPEWFDVRKKDFESDKNSICFSQTWKDFEKFKEDYERDGEDNAFPTQYFDSHGAIPQDFDKRVDGVSDWLNELHFEQRKMGCKVKGLEEPKGLRACEVLGKKYLVKDSRNVKIEVEGKLKVDDLESETASQKYEQCDVIVKEEKTSLNLQESVEGLDMKDPGELKGSSKPRKKGRLQKVDTSLGKDYIAMLGSKDQYSESETGSESESETETDTSLSTPHRETESDFLQVKERKKCSSRRRTHSHRRPYGTSDKGTDRLAYADDENEESEAVPESSYPNLQWTKVAKEDQTNIGALELFEDVLVDGRNSRRDGSRKKIGKARCSPESASEIDGAKLKRKARPTKAINNPLEQIYNQEQYWSNRETSKNSYKASSIDSQENTSSAASSAARNWGQEQQYSGEYCAPPHDAAGYEQYLWQQYSTYSRYAAYFHDLYERSRNERRMREAYVQQQHYIRYMAKTAARDITQQQQH